MRSSKINNQHLCLLSCPVTPVDGLQLFATCLSESFASPWEAGQSEGLRSSLSFCRHHQHCQSWDYRAQELCCFWIGFKTAIMPRHSPKALENPGWCTRFLTLQPELSHPGGSRGLGWAEMVPNLSQWGWTLVEGLFWLFSHHMGPLPQPFTWVRTGMGDIEQVAKLYWSWLRTVSSLQYPPDPPVEGWVGPQKPLWGFGVFLLCRRKQEPPLPEP